MEKNGEVSSERNNKFKTWWLKRSKQEKYLLGAALIISTLLIITIGLYPITGGPGLCSSPSCVRTSMELQNYIDLDQDPCHDFYQFACGKFLKNSNGKVTRSVRHIIEEGIQAQIRTMLEQPIYFDDPKAFNLGKKFYRACMNESAIEASGLTMMRQIFQRIGGWPTLIGNNWDRDKFNWTDSLYKLRQIGINFEFFFILSVEEDQTGQYILTIRDPSYTPSTISSTIKTLYHRYMVDVALAFGAQREQAERDQFEVMDFLLEIAKISETSKQEQNEPKYYTLRELQHQFSGVPWYNFINNILKPTASIHMSDVIKVEDPVYLRKMIYFLHQRNDRNIANFICWHIIQHLIPFLPSKILNNAHNYFESINGKYSREPRWSTCVNETKNRLKSVVLAAYINEYIGDDVKRQVISLIQNIKLQFKLNLYKLKWLEMDEIDRAVAKIMSTNDYLPSSSQLVDDEVIRVYEQADILEDNVLTSALNLDYANTNIEYGKLGKSAKDNILKHSSFVTGLEINFLPKENALIIPVGLFHRFFYDKERPNYINFGILGSIIANKIFHVVIEAEEGGNQLRSLWSSQSLTRYEEKLKCLERQYKQMSLANDFQTLNKTLNRDEDMADLSGMKVAYDTYTRWVKENNVEPLLPGLNYSPNQMFWISSTIQHCTKYSTTQILQRYIDNYRSSLEQFRVNGPLQNIPEFAYDFGCPLGSKMNPVDKCLVW